jgi:hypothetical protein
LFLCGLWFPVWLLIGLNNVGNYRCYQCGSLTGSSGGRIAVAVLVVLMVSVPILGCLGIGGLATIGSFAHVKDAADRQRPLSTPDNGPTGEPAKAPPKHDEHPVIKLLKESVREMEKRRSEAEPEAKPEPEPEHHDPTPNPTPRPVERIRLYEKPEPVRPAKPARPADPEDEAATRLRLAKTIKKDAENWTKPDAERRRLGAAYQDMLRKIVKQYPGTKAAAEAQAEIGP